MDISKLSKKDKLELLDALEAKKQLQIRKGANYVPNAGQMRVHESTKSIRVVTAGNGGGAWRPLA